LLPVLDHRRSSAERLEAPARSSRAVASLSKEEIDQMTAGRMGAEHDYLNALLDEGQPRQNHVA
jgi:hypothetical protein